MSGRGHVDVNERRLRPIYDCLDSGNNKKAVQEADRLLKKQKDLLCAKALRSLALIRLGRQDETMATLQEVHAQHPHDEHTLQAMAMCYRDVYRLDLIADMYENAYKCKPDSEEILNALFMAYVRLGIYKKQQQVAMALHKLRPQKNPYYFWAVMSIVMQAQEDEKLGKTMFLPLAEKMTLKYIQEGKLEAEAEVRLFLIILQSMGKNQEALDVLKGPLAAKLTSEPDFPKFMEAELLTKLQRWPLVNARYRRILTDEPDQWQSYKEYFSSAFHLIDSGWTPKTGDSSDSEADSIDHTVDLMVDFIKSLTPCPARGPFLAQFELKRMLKERGDDKWHEVFGQSTELLKEYLAKFGSKPCCYHDLQLYVDLFTSDEIQQVLDEQLNHLSLGRLGDSGDIKFAQDPKLIQQHLTLLQLQRLVGVHHQLSADQLLVIVGDLYKHYEQGLLLGETLLSTDLQYVDNYMLLIIHILYDVYTTTGNISIIWHAVLLLQKAQVRSPANFQFKLLLIQLYARLGAASQCYSFYELLDIKHIQHDSLGYVVGNHILRLGHLTRAGNLYDNMLKFFMSVHKDTSDFLISSYKYGSFPKVQEFVNFRDRLQNSLQFAIAMVEKLLLDIVSTTDSHKSTQALLTDLAVDPLVEKTDFKALRDNRDCEVFLVWDPPTRVSMDNIKEQSFTEEKSWLRLRNLVARCLVAVGRIGASSKTEPSPASVQTEPDGFKNGESGAAAETTQLSSSLAKVVSELYTEYDCKASSQDCLQGPFRTRLIPYLRLGLGKHLIELLTLLTSLDQIRDEPLTSGNPESKGEAVPSLDLVQSIQDYVVKNQLRNGPKTETNSRVENDVNLDVLENFILITEHVCFVAVILGTCQHVLKPIKLAMSKRGKKRKETDPRLVTVCNYYTSVLDVIIDITKKLIDSFLSVSSTDSPVTSTDNVVLRFSELSLKDGKSLPRDEVVERDVLNKVRISLQQTSCEMMELLNRKQKYLENIRL